MGLNLSGTDLWGMTTTQQETVKKIVAFLEAKSAQGVTTFPYIPQDMFFGFDLLESKALTGALMWAWNNQTAVPGYILNNGFLDGESSAISYTAKQLVTEGVGGGIVPASLVIWGDSTATMTAADSTSTVVRYLGNDWAIAGLDVSGHPLDIRNVGGNSGLRTDQIIPTFSAQVAPYRAKYVILPVGTNNIIQNYTAAATIADLSTMVALCKSNGAIPVVMTVSCGESISGNATQRAVWLDYNAQVRSLATAQGIPCIDIEQVYVDPATVGTTYAPLAGYTDGTVHPANKGAIKWGQKFAEWLNTLPTRSLATGLANAFGNQLFTGTSGTLNGATGSAPTGGTVSKGAGTTVASSIVARADGVSGNWWQIAASGASSTDFLSLILGTVTGIGVGDTIRGLCDVEIDSGQVNMAYVSMKLRFNGATMQWSESFSPVLANGSMLDPFPKMHFRTPEIVVPVGTTSITPYLYVTNAANSAWSVTARVGGVFVAKV